MEATRNYDMPSEEMPRLRPGATFFATRSFLIHSFLANFAPRKITTQQHDHR